MFPIPPRQRYPFRGKLQGAVVAFQEAGQKIIIYHLIIWCSKEECMEDLKSPRRSCLKGETLKMRGL